MVSARIWLKFKSTKLLCIFLFPARMKKFQSKIKPLEWSQHFSHCKTMGIFSDAQGQITPQSIVESSRISNSSKILWLSLLPAKMKKIHLKMKTLECSQHYTSIVQTLKGR